MVVYDVNFKRKNRNIKTRIILLVPVIMLIMDTRSWKAAHPIPMILTLC